MNPPAYVGFGMLTPVAILVVDELPEHNTGALISQFREFVFGDNPYGLPTEGTEESVTALTRDDIVNFHQKYYVPSTAVLAVVGGATILLERMQFGRHIYAVGGNAEAARRAGINVPRVRTICFVIGSMTAGVAGVIYCSTLGGMTTNINGGQLVLYAVAAAVIGGTSLSGGRGRAIHGLLGGLVIGAIYNGLYLLGLEIQWQLIITGLVLLAAVSVDSLSRK